MLILSYKYRLYPTQQQSTNIDFQLAEACKLYNAALEHRMWCYRQHGISISCFEQIKEIKFLRNDGVIDIYSYTMARLVIQKLDTTFKAFYKRGGYPRFKTVKRYNTIEFKYGDGLSVKNNRIKIKGVGEIKTNWHRELPSTIKTCKVSRKNGKYYAVFSCEVTPVELPKTGKSVGIDVGIESFATLSNGKQIANPRYYENSQKKLRRLQRSVARKKKGSNRRRKAVQLLAKHHEKIDNQRTDFLHKISHKLVNENDIIAVEKLNTKGLAKGILAKQVNDVGWGIFFNMLSYKAESAGKELVEVNPAYTSQTCHKCGNIEKKKLSDRWHNCAICGYSIHRDVNAAKNILGLATSQHALT